MKSKYLVVEVINFKNISDSLRFSLGIGLIEATHHLVCWWFNLLGLSGVKMLAVVASAYWDTGVTQDNQNKTETTIK